MKNSTRSRFRPLLRFTLWALLCLFTAGSVSAQSRDSRGTDFWLMFNDNYSTPALTIFVTSDVNTTGTVSIPGIPFTANFTVTANTITPVTIPASVQTHTSNVIDSKGIHVTSQQEVTVYGLSYLQFSTDAYLGLPTDVLGTSYIVLTYTGQSSEFGVVSTANGTVVTITPSVTVGTRTAGVPYNITLNQGQTYELQAGSLDLTGTIITSTQPIGVMGANVCANIPPGVSYCDHINEMLPPTTTWGKKFGTVPLKSRTNGDTWRFMASENNTVILINGVAQAPINRGKFVEKILTAQSVIESDKPILVAQYANGSDLSGNPGDPFMMLIPPLEQFLAKYTVTTVSGYAAHYINLVAPAAIVGTVTLDGVAVPSSAFTPIGSSGFSGAQITVQTGVHNLQGTLPFGVFMYGFNSDDSYGYPGGQSFSEVARVATLVLTPETGTANVGTQQCFNAVVNDQFGNPLPGIRVDFGITGANPGSTGFANTNASGIAQFCYSGANAGTDTIKASVGTLNDGSTFVWIKAGNVYYSKPAGDLHNVLTWGMNPDGSGTNPPDFGAGKTFMLANRGAAYMLTNGWTVGGILNIPSGSQLQLNGYTLSIADLAGTGLLSGTMTSNLVVTLPSTGGTSLNFASGAGSLNGLTITSTSTTSIGTALDLFGVLTAQSGTLVTGNLLTLKSTASNTARVAPVTGTISGSVTVERYIPARRAWRIMSAPVAGAQTINASWQEGVTTSSGNSNPFSGYGTHITEGAASDGLDHNPLIAMPSVKKYTSATDTWSPLANTNATPVTSDAYMLFVRGDRGISLGLNTVPPNNTTLRARGPLKTGDQTFPVSAAGFTAIPNPFASPINFATITRNNVQNNFYLWDPKMGGTDGVGGYVLLSFNGSTYDIIPASVSPESQYIQSGQGFLVHSTGTAGSVVIKETDKSATAATDVFSTGGSAQPRSPFNVPVSVSTTGLRISLQSPTTDNLPSVLDEVFAAFGSQYSNQVDAMDALKIANIQENLAIARGSNQLMVDRAQTPEPADRISLKLWNTTARKYMLEFNPVNLTAGLHTAYLADNYLKTTTPIDLHKISQVFFTVTSDVASANPSRFSVLFQPDAATAGEVRKEFLPYPNPVVGKSIRVLFNNQPEGTYNLELVNSLGQSVSNTRLRHGGGSSVQIFDLPSKPARGVYFLNIRNSGSKSTIKIFIN